MTPFWQEFIAGVVFFLLLPSIIRWTNWLIANTELIHEMWLIWPEWVYFLRDGIRAGGGSVTKMPDVNRNFQIALRRKAERTGNPRIREMADEHLAYCRKHFGMDFL